MSSVFLRIGREAALSSRAFDAGSIIQEVTDGVFFGHTTTIKLKRNLHERYETAIRLEALRRQAGIRAPRLLDSGLMGPQAGRMWWTVSTRVRGETPPSVMPGHQRSLGSQLRRWHEFRAVDGLRLDDPGALGVMLGCVRGRLPDLYEAIAAGFAEACVGLPVVAIHGDAAVCHNTLYRDGELVAVIDPGAIEIGPALLDLAWALAVDLPHGGRIEPLLDGYGRQSVDMDALLTLLHLMMIRRLVDVTFRQGCQADRQWLVDHLTSTGSSLARKAIAALQDGGAGHVQASGV